jgi:Na+-transporting methylmalonyl-CoA/oxaloacetate decarboxylase gamma subunit
MITALALSPVAQELNNDTVSPGLIGSGVVFLLIIALVFLLRSMSKQIGRIQAPKQADLDQAEWEAKQAKSDATPPE